MILIGRLLMTLGFVGTIILLILAFWHLFSDQDAAAMQYFMIIPFSFMALFAGLATVVLFEPRDVE